MSEDKKVESAENLQMMSEDFMKLKANLDKLEPFYLRALRTLNLNSFYTKARNKWALQKHKGEEGVLKDGVLLTNTVYDEPMKVQVSTNSFKRT
jgi:hypothetical protein